MMRVEDTGSLDIKGFLDHEEGMKLHEVARRAGRLGPCLEIGSYCGKSTVYLGLGVRESGGVLFSIDHHRGSEEQQPGQQYFDPDLLDQATGRVDTFKLFRAAVEKAGLEDTVVPLVTRSEVAARMWSMPLGLVFIDGGHSYPTVFSDYAAWMPHVMPGGYLLIHDIFPDPKDGGQAPYYIHGLALKSGLFVEEERVKTLGVLRRIPIGQVPDEVRNKRDW
jgi:MMP 1-O-methyltransferase